MDKIAVPPRFKYLRATASLTNEANRDTIMMMASAGCPLEDIAGEIGITKGALLAEFGDLIVRCQSTVRNRLRAKQLQLAMSGNVSMLQFLGRVMLDQKTVEHKIISGPDGGPIETKTTLTLNTGPIMDDRASVEAHAPKLLEEVIEEAELEYPVDEIEENDRPRQ